MDGWGRIGIATALVAAGFYCLGQHEALENSRQALDELTYRRDILREGRDSEMRFNRRLERQDPRLLNWIARSRGYLLPGEADWWVLEQRNALRWPDLWGTMEAGEQR